LFSTDLHDDILRLDEFEAHHVRHVLRMAAGDTVELFDGRGTTAQAVIEKADRKTVEVRILRRDQRPPRQTGRIILAVSMAKGQRFETLIEQGTELGVDHFVPVLFQRTVKQAAGNSAVQRYHKIAVAAAKQCGRVFLPKIDPAEGFEDALERLTTEYPNAKMIFGGFSSEATPLLPWSIENRDTVAIVGPEGGLADQEQQILIRAGVREVKICQTTLRIETAALALAAILCAKRDS
jgi:16S rRNA (uracil1498-N3)-methyltransferase